MQTLLVSGAPTCPGMCGLIETLSAESTARPGESASIDSIFYSLTERFLRPAFSDYAHFSSLTFFVFFQCEVWYPSAPYLHVTLPILLLGYSGRFIRPIECVPSACRKRPHRRLKRRCVNRCNTGIRALAPIDDPKIRRPRHPDAPAIGARMHHRRISRRELYIYQF